VSTSLPVNPVPGHPAMADYWYRKHMGWRTIHGPEAVRLRLGDGVVGFQVPTGLGRVLLARFAQAGVVAPAVDYPAEAKIVMLADANGGWWSQDDLPRGVVLLSSPAEVPLPPSVIGGSVAGWAGPVDPRRRWLPLAEGVLQEIRSILGLTRRPASRRGRVSSPWPGPLRAGRRA
jgi:hypothetical protein